MNPRTVTGLNVFKSTIGILPDFNRILKGIYHLATAKPEKYRSLGSMFELRTKQHPDKCFLQYQEKAFTYQQMNEWANKIAHNLARKGIQSGDVVAIMIENRPETLACVLATAKLGAVASMINTTQKDDVLIHSLTIVKPKAFIIGEECYQAFESVLSKIGVDTPLCYCVPDASNTKAPTGSINLAHTIKEESTNNPDSTNHVQMHQPLCYIFTSGTTGLPKASVQSHFRWVKAMGTIGLAAFRLRKDDIFYICLPLYHANALTVSWGSVVGAGATMVLARKFSASNFWDDCRKYGITASCYIGELCRYLLNQPPRKNDRNHCVRVMGGNGLRPDIWMQFKQRFGVPHIMELYAASECNIAFVNTLNLDMTAGFCPLSYEVVEYDIENDKPVLNDKGYMIPVNRNEVGLLVSEVTDRSPFEGYTSEAASNARLLKNVFKQNDHYFNSGDLVQKQGFGHVAFIDRLGDTFRWKGENVATTEVEEVSNQHPQVTHSVVYGVQVPKTDGRAGMASITLNTDINAFNFTSYTQHLREKLPGYAVPLFLRVRKEQDITGTFKNKKGELKKEGFNPQLIDEPIYVLLPKANTYVAINNDIIDKINLGEFCF